MPLTKASEMSTRIINSKNTKQRYLSALEVAHFNTNLLPGSAVDIDLLTDSWAERTMPTDGTTHLSCAQIVDFVRSLYGWKHIIPFVQGRLAEAVVSTATVTRDSIVASNALFPTARFHIESRGGRLEEIDFIQSGDTAEPNAFKGDLCVWKLKALVEAKSQLSCVWIEACANATFGSPVSLENVRKIHEVCTSANIPVVLDATRLLENVLLYIERTLCPDKPISVLREYCRNVDVCVMSGTKDFCLSRGGFIGTNSDALFSRMSDIALGYGGHLASVNSIQGTICGDPFTKAQNRLQRVKMIHQSLKDQPVQADAQPGGHAIFVDVGRVLPDLSHSDHVVQAFLSHLYLHCGVRGAEHYCTPLQQKMGKCIARFAIPVGGSDDLDILPLLQTIQKLSETPETVQLLQQTHVSPGLIGKLGAHYQPLN